MFPLNNTNILVDFVLRVFILAGHVSSAQGLEVNNHISDLHVPLLLQMCQDSSSEEHFTLADAVQIGV